MQKIIRDQQVVEDPFQLVENPDAALPEGDLIVPLPLWQAKRSELQTRSARVGVWLETDCEPETIADDLERWPVVAVRFKVFSDGRGLSLAVLLRTRFGYRGELRAIGDVLQDQLAYMSRCGFNAFQPRADKDPADVLRGLRVMNNYYQSSVIEPEPLFRRTART